MSRSNLRQCLMLFHTVATENNGKVPYQSNTTVPWVINMWEYAMPGIPFPAWTNDSSNLKNSIFYCPGIPYADTAPGAIIRPFAANIYLHSPYSNMEHFQPSLLPDPSRTMLLITGTSSSVATRTQIGFRFGDGTLANVGYVDCHIETQSRDDLQPQIDSYNSVFWKGDLQ
ncbi:hypothetical protein H5P28_04325 [Ruficoccus amylovorans]|uniref:Uncharacterized protein n=1 Tax=Ruficoccus amylovorans TaxID=1804625 RepID=A0A842HDQ2_9BACT|nr:hypothetical protein [Ruficoccus amylovorans]MBC2593481.1 hypothetical protein [Ruficoccus amylovorans]